MSIVGKRNFLLKASQYLKEIEATGEALTITHQNEPRLKIVPYKTKSIRDLAGTIAFIKTKEDINKPVMEGYDSW